MEAETNSKAKAQLEREKIELEGRLERSQCQLEELKSRYGMVKNK